MTTPASFSSTNYTPDRLVALDNYPLVARNITLISGQDLSRGAVLGKITASGKYTLSLSASADGSETPDCILAMDCDASGGDATAVAYFVGGFNEDALTIGTGHTAASIREGLRTKGIHLIDPLGA